MKTRLTNHKLRATFHTIVCIAVFIAVFCIGCEPQAPATTGTPKPETKADEPKTPVVAEAEVTEPIAPPETAAEPAEMAAEPAETAVEPAETAAEPTKPDVAVTVNGIDILESKVEERIKPRLDRLTSQGAKLPDAYVQRIKQQTVDGMIVELLMNQEIKGANIVVADEDVIAHLEESGASQQPPLSLEDIKALIESQGQSFEEVKSNIKKGLSYQKFMEARFTDEMNVTEEDAQKYYSENKGRFKVPERVRVSHILIKPDTSDPNTDPNDANAASEAKAQDLLGQIKAGADFAELAKANSDCPSSAQGGDLGLKPRGSWVKPFEEAAFGLEVGQVSDVVHTRFGYHIIKVTEHQDPNTIPFEQAKDDIINWMTRRKQNDISKKYIESLKAAANIVYPPGKEPKAAPTPPSPRMIRPPSSAPKPEEK